MEEPGNVVIEGIDTERLQAIREYVDRMPSLSTTVTKVMEVCNRANPSPNDLNKVISFDPVLTGQVLKLINSAYYSLPNQITSLGRAIIMLGINTVKNLALSTAILGTLDKAGALDARAMDTFWNHSICVGVTAKALAARMGVAANLREEYFVAGLLHDLGKIPLQSCFADQYGQALALADLEQGPLYRAEQLMLGVDHAVAGGEIAAKWQFSLPICDSITFHHDPLAGSEECRQLTSIVALANLFANLYDYGAAGDRYPAGADIGGILDLVGVSWPEMQELQVVVDTEIDKAKVFLQVSKG